MVRNFLLIAYLFLFLASTPYAASASDLNAEQRAAAEHVFTHLLSPFCPGRTLYDCPSSGATELKEEIRKRIQEGENPDTILTSLYARYGEETRAVPQSRGFGLLAWVLPIIFLLLGLGWILRLLSASTSNEDQKPAVSENLDPELEKRIQSELDKL